MRIAVCIPFFGDCPHRRAALEHVLAHYASIAKFGFEVSVGRGDTRAESRNIAAAAVPDADVLLFMDAEMVLPWDAMMQACEQAWEWGQMVMAYRRVVYLSKAHTRTLMDGGTLDHLSGTRRPGAISGANAVRADRHREVGGYDERFDTWGGEDRAYHYAHLALFGAAPRIDATAIHLWHPTDPLARNGGKSRGSAVKLANRYKAAAGIVKPEGICGRIPNAALSVDGMMALMSEPGGPLDKVNA